MRVNLQYAQEHLAELGSAVDAGEEVQIARTDKPSLSLVVCKTTPQPAKTGKRILGAGRGELRVPSWEEWQAMDKELERAMLDAPLATVPDRTGLFGALKGQVWYTDDWDSSEVNEAIAKSFNESKLFPDDPAE